MAGYTPSDQKWKSKEVFTHKAFTEVAAEFTHPTSILKLTFAATWAGTDSILMTSRAGRSELIDELEVLKGISGSDKQIAVHPHERALPAHPLTHPPLLPIHPTTSQSALPARTSRLARAVTGTSSGALRRRRDRQLDQHLQAPHPEAFADHRCAGTQVRGPAQVAECPPRTRQAPAMHPPRTRHAPATYPNPTFTPTPTSNPNPNPKPNPNPNPKIRTPNPTPNPNPNPIPSPSPSPSPNPICRTQL